MQSQYIKPQIYEVATLAGRNKFNFRAFQEKVLVLLFYQGNDLHQQAIQKTIGHSKV